MPTYVEHLPAIYREDPGTGRVPAAVPRARREPVHRCRGARSPVCPRCSIRAAAPESSCCQLARWLALDVSPSWDDAERRDAVADAYVEAAARGRSPGLRAALRTRRGVDAWIEEPLRQSEWWALAADDASPDAERETSVLGVTTMLAAAEPQGAVLGSTATVNRSHLIGNDEYGVPLFDDVAHRFVVRLYEGAALSDERLRARDGACSNASGRHTRTTSCAASTRSFEIGVQSRIGIDAIVGGAPLPAALDDDARSATTSCSAANRRAASENAARSA